MGFDPEVVAVRALVYTRRIQVFVREDAPDYHVTPGEK